MDFAILFAFLGIAFVVSLSFIGFLFFKLNQDFLKKLLLVLVAFSAGTLIGDAFFHLLPEAIENNQGSFNIWIFAVIGLLIFFILEKIIHWRHCHILTSKDHPHELGMMNLIGDGLHNFLDGIIMMSSFCVDLNLGFATMLAIIAHEVPQKIGDFGILIYAGYSKWKALWLNLGFSLISFLGGIFVLIWIQNDAVLLFLNTFTAGSFIYIAVADLIPEIKKESSLKYSLIQLVSILFGLFIMYFLRFLK
ncbi:MAG: ZIP family metal transporter [Candidatus Pacebacteria bacterium]|nr:ZIP family metal transporter [Candidatus Paceibacterota bacterium]